MNDDYRNGKLCYVELPADDIAASARFYTGAFGWSVRERDDGALAFDDGTGGIGGIWVTGRRPSPDPGVLLYIMVAEMAASIAAVVAHGGEIVRQPRGNAPELTARFRDPAGNVLGLYQEPTLVTAAAQVTLQTEDRTAPRSPATVFHDLVNGVAAGAGPELADLYAEDAYVVHPFAPGGPAPLRGRAQLREHFSSRPGDTPRHPRRVENAVVHQTVDPEVIVAEFRYHVMPKNEPSFDIPAIFVLRVHDGLIAQSRDYFHHRTARAGG